VHIHPGPAPPHRAHRPRETIEGLSSAICKDLRPPTLAEGLDFGDEEGAFSGTAAACLSVLVLGINTHLDAPLQVAGPAAPAVRAMRRGLRAGGGRWFGSAPAAAQAGML
jgi:hypothetical protein